jgi:hypothetical protein
MMKQELVTASSLSPWERFKAEPDIGMELMCVALAEGHSLRAFAARAGVNTWTLLRWIRDDPKRLSMYDEACEARADYWRDVIEAVHSEPIRRTDKGNLDPADVAHKRLKLDALKWTASKLAPKRYGDKVEIDATVKVDAVEELREFLKSSRLPIKDAE